MAFEMQGKHKEATSTTQNFLEVAEVKDNVIITPEGGLRSVIAVSSINFVLKSPDEQSAILARYQDFLNSLDFPFQILVQSRRLDIHGYLEKINERLMQQTNELLRIQTEEYIEYIKKLLEFGNIMNKTFYIIVPFITSDATKKGFFQKIKNLINPTQQILISEQLFMDGLHSLDDRCARIESELGSMGLRSMRLNTKELVELCYHSYNVGAVSGSLSDVGAMKLG
ncbi:MAG: hypothetical protein AAB871_03725 [Patescibacteria group bacterium]